MKLCRFSFNLRIYTLEYTCTIHQRIYIILINLDYKHQGLGDTHIIRILYCTSEIQELSLVHLAIDHLQLGSSTTTRLSGDFQYWQLVENGSQYL